MITFNVQIVGKDNMLEPMRKHMEKLTFMMSDEQVEEKADELCAALASEFKCENQGSGLSPVFVFGEAKPKPVPKKKKMEKPSVDYSIEKKLQKKVSKVEKKSSPKKNKTGFTQGSGLLF